MRRPQCPLLAVINDTIPELSTDLWVLTHEDLRKTARIAAVLTFLGNTFGKPT